MIKDISISAQSAFKVLKSVRHHTIESLICVLSGDVESFTPTCGPMGNQGDPKSRNGGMVEWWNGGMVEWWNGGMVEW